MKTNELIVDCSTGLQSVVEIDADVMTEAEGIASQAEKDRIAANDAIKAALAANDLKIVRALLDGDTDKIAAHRKSQAALRARLT